MRGARARFPDLTSPPGWTGFALPPQVRLIPPGTTKASARATIIVSPIAPRLPRMPPLDQLIAQAIDAEASLRLDILERTGPNPAPSDTGLHGISCELRVRDRNGGEEQRRVYALYCDDKFYYGINYMAFGSEHDKHLDTFWKTARSMRPFVGAVVPPTAPPTPAID